MVDVVDVAVDAPFTFLELFGFKRFFSSPHMWQAVTELFDNYVVSVVFS